MRNLLRHSFGGAAETAPYHFAVISSFNDRRFQSSPPALQDAERVEYTRTSTVVLFRQPERDLRTWTSGNAEIVASAIRADNGLLFWCDTHSRLF